MRGWIAVAALIAVNLLTIASADAFGHGRRGRYPGYGNEWGGYRGYGYGGSPGFEYYGDVGQPHFATTTTANRTSAAVGNKNQEILNRSTKR